MKQLKPLVTIDYHQLGALKQSATEAANRRARVCLHSSTEDQIQEMLIVLSAGTYFKPHKHPPHKTESYHLVEGKMRIVHFWDDGRPRRTIDMTTPGGGGVFLYRLAEPIFHTVIPLTPFVIYHETFLGPFSKSDDIIYCSWAPDEHEVNSGRNYLDELMKLEAPEQIGLASKS